MTFGATAIAGASLAGSFMSSRASSSAAKTQADASEAAIAQQFAMAQESIKAQQETLNAQLRNADATKAEQIRAQQEVLANQLRVATETRDAQLGVAREVLGKQEKVYTPYQEAGLAGQNRLREYLGIGGDPRSQGYGQYANAQFTPEAFAAGQDPGYAFRMKEGLKAVDAQAAARGGLISGAALKASQRFGQDMASQEYQNAYNRFQTTRQNTLAPYQSLQGVGLNAAGGLSNVAGAYGTNSMGALGGYGGAAGGAYGALGTGLYNAIGTAGNQINSAYGNYGNQLTGALTGFGSNQANLTTGAANATASGQVGSANALNQGISGVSNAYYQNQMLNMFRDKNTATNNAANQQQLQTQYGSGNVFTPSGRGYAPSTGFVPSGVSDYAF